ncbi:MAG: RNA pseudouridine synthase [Elusimicrobia bacterium]|nr:RNA pseudouridine synthase [Elusimicrobiota bacterium]
MPVIPARGAEAGRPLSELVAEALGRRVWVVHRIDAATSGLVVFALSAPEHKRLSRAFEGRAVKKTYLAAVKGSARTGSCDSPLREFGSGRVAPAPDGRPSRTSWRPLRPCDGGTLLEVTIETGRRHQIRAHLTAAGFPILGDPLYGPAPRPVGGAPRLMLHAWKLELPDGQGGTLSLEAPMLQDFRSVLGTAA